jgi:molybdenum cofactor cytidylyltransferase
MISGVVLAAGTSSRFGRPKQLADLTGKPLLQHVIDALEESSLDDIVVVLGHEARRIEAALRLPDKARTVTNVHYALGQATSLRAGLEALGPQVNAALIVLGDQPGLTTAMVAAVLNEQATSAAPIVRARFRSVPGHPVVAARSEWERWRALEGDEGARSLIEQSADQVRHVDFDVPPLTDVDTPEQLRALELAASR